MLLQTNSYIVPKDKRAEHARLLARFKQTLARLGCDHFESYEQVGANWSGGETPGRFVQIMRFRDRKHQQQVQQSERTDPQAQTLIKEFCELINFPYQQQQGLFAVGFYNSVLAVAPTRVPGSMSTDEPPAAASESATSDQPDAEAPPNPVNTPPTPPQAPEARAERSASEEPAPGASDNGDAAALSALDEFLPIAEDDAELSPDDIAPPEVEPQPADRSGRRP